MLLALFLIGYITLMVIVIREPVSEISPLKEDEAEEDSAGKIVTYVSTNNFLF